MNSNEKWYSVSEVAHRYRVSCDTIRRRIKGGKLRALRLPDLTEAASYFRGLYGLGERA